MPPHALWNLYNAFSIYQAALLIAGHDPQDFADTSERDMGKKAPGYTIARDALVNAVETDGIVVVRKVLCGNEYDSELSLNIYATLIEVDKLDAFLRSRQMVCQLFSDRTKSLSDAPAISEMYSVKLNAANKAWTAVTSNPALLRGKSPKQALQKWLTEHAGELGLLNKDGKPNQTGIGEICKVANWRPEGGATPTATTTPAEPSPALTPTPPIQSATAKPSGDDYGFSSGPRGPKETFDLDDEIPF